MRDRRNTNLSTSSSSSDSSANVSPRDLLNEKADFPLALEEGNLLDSETKEYRCRSLSRRVFCYKLLAVTCIAALIIIRFVNSSHNFGEPPRPLPNDERIVNHVDLTVEPTTIVYHDATGVSRWTVSIPSKAPFPLLASQYQDICRSVQNIQNIPATSTRFSKFKLQHGRNKYYAHDSTFTDIDTAISIGVLPFADLASASTCESSLTFSLDTQSASFGKSLLLLWLSYGLAKYEGRAFFIDDSRWPYGKYTYYFAPTPQPSCSPPPPSHIVPCPHEAKHLLVSAATAKWTFGPAFDAYFAQRKHASQSQKPTVFQLARAGYEALFKLVGDDEEYARTRAADLRTSTGPLVGMHIRRGDLHPLELEFSRDYLPLERYTNAARSLLQQTSSSSSSPSPSSSTSPSSDQALILASDDPNTITSPDLLNTATPHPVLRAQDRIQLATKAALDRTSPAEPIREPGSAYVKHVDENAGWDGGFYTRQFFALGQKKHDAPAADHAAVFVLSEDTVRMRELIARSYLLDLAVLARADAVVCAVSSAACRVLGVMLGHDAVRDGRWVNVDDARAWSWDGRR